MNTEIAILRLGIVFFSSLFFGLVRQKLHKPIGFGTFIFVSLGSTALSIAAVTLHADNPLPLLGAIVTGIGFLGAGALIRYQDKTIGFTSASSIWIFAIFGMVVGLGEYLLGTIIYFVAWIVVFIDMYLEHHAIGAYQKKITIATKKLIPTAEFDKVFAGRTYKLLSVDVHKTNDKLTATFLVEGRKEEINQLSRELLSQPWFESCKVE